jgi:hypothetical protein
MDKNVRFTVVNSRFQEGRGFDEYAEIPLDIYPERQHFVIKQPRGREIPITKQQLGELGTLFLALAGKEWDADSAVELLDGYGATAQDFADIQSQLNLD